VTGADAEPLALPPTVSAQYEVLRSAMLGAHLPVDARRGLNVFLARGMWAWARMMVAVSARPEPIRTRSLPCTQPLERQSVIYALAGMAVTINERRTP
jgi:hypothetical protein